ncbi:MAG: double-strand break repair protein AddB, partial [Minwuiales bacterium]|nr:double-strand break repair protein AddB [Minwuiales bacterium]
GFGQGGVILPGLDTETDADNWAAIGDTPTHGQFGLHQLLARLDADRDEVRDWPAPGIEPAAVPRVRLIADSLRPAATTDRWPDLPSPAAEATDGLTWIDCPGPHEEAGTIALALREVLETPGHTAALITPDRELGRRVAAELRRWGLEIDDSGGVPLAHTPPGTFLTLTAAMAAEDLAPVALLAALKHPLAAGGMAPIRFRARVRELEWRVLRGPRPAPGFAGLRTALEAAEAPEPLLDWLEGLAAAARPMMDLMAAGRADLADLLVAHVEFAEWLSATDADDGLPLWAEPAGEKAAAFVSDLHKAATELGPISVRSWPALLEGLMTGQAVRPVGPLHPRLNLWGPIEARLQRADLVVLGGLNDGTWPPTAQTDPWMSRPMRTDFGLPQPERRIGLAAHDFAQLSAAPNVLLTRATKVDGTPTVASRWLLRLESLLKGAGQSLDAPDSNRHLDWQQQLDTPSEVKPATPPEPRPPVEARPTELSVTQIETLIRDPYAIYARHVLKLKPLLAVAADPGAADRGTIIHKALETFIAGLPDGPLPDDAEARLIDAGEQAFRDVLDRPAVQAFWWPRFQRAARWFLTQERMRRTNIRTSHVEVDGRLTMMAGDPPFQLKAKADRIDLMVDGRIEILDYKTGGLPSDKQVEIGLSPQLSLEAAMAAAGAFASIDAATVGALTFMRLGGGEPPGEARSIKADPEALGADARARLERLIASYNREETPYLSRPRPMWASRFSDYDHLARVKEWSASGGGET